MSLVARLQPVAETVSEMEQAAGGRFQEGSHLVRSGLYHAGICLLGYAAEIWLKTALCRVDPALAPTDLVDARIGPARLRWKSLFGGSLPSGHDLLFLCLSLEDERQRVGKPSLSVLSVVASRAFNACTSRMYEHWFVAMRYRPQNASETEAHTMRDDVGWLRANYEFLWR